MFHWEQLVIAFSLLDWTVRFIVISEKLVILPLKLIEKLQIFTSLGHVLTHLVVFYFIIIVYHPKEKYFPAPTL